MDAYWQVFVNYIEYSHPTMVIIITSYGMVNLHKACQNSVFTNQHVRKYISDFKITSWHISDHLPLNLNSWLPSQISTDMLIVCAKELNNSFQPVTKIPTCRFKFNFEIELMRCYEIDMLSYSKPLWTTHPIILLNT